MTFYFSEMSVSDRHGGGITLQRVLGEDLRRFDAFLHVSRFGSDLPPAEEIAGRSETRAMWSESNAVRRLIGRGNADWLSRREVIRRGHARRIAKEWGRRFGSEDAPRALVCPQGALSLLTIAEIRRRHPLQYVTWMMDDHLLRWNGEAWEYPAGYHALMGKHLRDAEKVFAISPQLAAFYEKEFGVQAEVLFGSADVAGEPVWRSPSETGKPRLAYFGSILAWQLDPLQALAARLAGAGATLDIFTPAANPPAGLVEAGVKVLPSIPRDAVIHEMRRYDAVVLPISSRDASRNMTEFNVATKMSECLASGTMSLVLGPANAAMVRYLEPYDAAAIIREPSLAGFEEVAARLGDAVYRKQILTNARRLVETQLSTEIMRRQWRSAELFGDKSGVGSKSSVGEFSKNMALL